jgi:hypothetical protein
MAHLLENDDLYFQWGTCYFSRAMKWKLRATKLSAPPPTSSSSSQNASNNNGSARGSLSASSAASLISDRDARHVSSVLCEAMEKFRAGVALNRKHAAAYQSWGQVCFTFRSFSSFFFFFVFSYPRLSIHFLVVAGALSRGHSPETDDEKFAGGGGPATASADLFGRIRTHH